ncbi:MarR family transcriptional regulator [Pseudonocardia nigra]|uniref:MarR family transcriptional regulator n=1 Tax=Pseudonocardia nigra TaxID=1921578 RepID=UPI001C5CCD05|nr:MarR family transcriptional regulator [Pseudonocardia nigra]
MSSSTTPDSHDTPTIYDHDARPDGDDGTVTDRVATASDRLWAALHARPGGTADELSGDAGIGRSTAAKILARWVADGTATRVPTDGRRSASRYVVPAPVDAAPPDGADDTATDPSGPNTGPTADPTEGTDDAATVDDADTDRSGAPDETTGDAMTAPSGAEVPAEAATDTTGSTPDPTAGTDDGAEATANADSAPATVVPDDVAGTPTTGTANTDDDPTEGDGPDDATPAATAAVRGRRLAPGALHGMVEDYLRDHPDGEFGPTKIGHDLGRSTGAVGNALERLVTAGYAVRTKDRPKRYALAPAARTDDDAAPEHTERPGT